MAERSGPADPHTGKHDMWHNDGPGFDVVPDIYYSANYYAEAAIEAITSHAKGEDATNPFFLVSESASTSTGGMLARQHGSTVAR